MDDGATMRLCSKSRIICSALQDNSSTSYSTVLAGLHSSMQTEKFNSILSRPSHRPSAPSIVRRCGFPHQNRKRVDCWALDRAFHSVCSGVPDIWRIPTSRFQMLVVMIQVYMHCSAGH